MYTVMTSTARTTPRVRAELLADQVTHMSPFDADNESEEDYEKVVTGYVKHGETTGNYAYKPECSPADNVAPNQDVPGGAGPGGVAWETGQWFEMRGDFSWKPQGAWNMLPAVFGRFVKNKASAISAGSTTPASTPSSTPCC